MSCLRRRKKKLNNANISYSFGDLHNGRILYILQAAVKALGFGSDDFPIKKILYSLKKQRAEHSKLDFQNKMLPSIRIAICYKVWTYEDSHKSTGGAIKLMQKFNDLLTAEEEQKKFFYVVLKNMEKSIWTV